MSRLAHGAKAAAVQALRAFHRALAQACPVAKGVIIGYHSIDRSGSGASLPPEPFAAQLDLLSELGFRTVTLDELLPYLRSPARGRRLAALTFDDGFASVHDEAWPLLSARGQVATVFLATDYLGRQASWRHDDGFDELGRLPMLSWPQVEAMARSGVFRFECHTASHPSLPAIPEERAREELERSRQAIADHVGRRPRWLCYPYGHYDARVIALVRSMGFDGACTIDAGSPAYAKDPYRLPRGMVMADVYDPVAEFAGFLSRFHDAYTTTEWARRLLRQVWRRWPESAEPGYYRRIEAP